MPHHLTVCCDRAVFRVLWVVVSDRLWLALLMMSALLAVAGSGLLGHLIGFHVYLCEYHTRSTWGHVMALTHHTTQVHVIAVIIIIIDFYGAYILRNLSSEAQQNRISRRNRKQGRAKVSIRTRDNRTFMVGMQFGIDMS